MPYLFKFGSDYFLKLQKNEIKLYCALIYFRGVCNVERRERRVGGLELAMWESVRRHEIALVIF